MCKLGRLYSRYSERFFEKLPSKHGEHEKKTKQKGIKRSNRFFHRDDRLDEVSLGSLMGLVASVALVAGGKSFSGFYSVYIGNLWDF